jgi:cyclase
MLRYAPPLLLSAFLVLAACGGDAPPPGAGGDASQAPSGNALTPAQQEAIRTADPFARGLGHEDFPRVKELAEGVYSYEQLRSAGEEWFTTVSLIVVTSEGVLIGDGQGNVEETQRLVDTVAQLTDQPITHVVIASDHGDHTAGNSAFPQDAAFIAHPTSDRVLREAAARRDPSSPAPPVVVPTELVADSVSLFLGGREIQILFKGRAHTGGDLVVHLPEERILFMSEAYLHRVFPAMRSAYPSEWVAMVERVQAMDVETYVPGHGFVDSPEILRDELELFRQAMVQVIETVSELHAAGLSLEEAQAQVDFGELEAWSLSSSQMPIAVAQVYRELNGELDPE